MKIKCLMNGLAVMAIAVAAVGCSHDDDLYTKKDNGELYKTSFEENIMGGTPIDAKQNWNTSEAVTLTITTEMAGQLKIYTANPVGKNTAALISQTISVGTTQITVAKPNDAKQLYAALYDKDGSVRTMEVSGNKATFTAPRSVSASSRARVNRAPQNPTEAGWDFSDPAADNDYKTALPGEVYPKGDYYMYGGAWPESIRKSYVLDEQETVQDINFWKGNADIYVTGKKVVNFINPGDGSATVTFYVLPGADLTFVSSFNYQKPTGIAMYISGGAKVTFEGDMTSNIYMYNRGEVTVNGVTGPYADGLMYNEHIITSKKNMAVFNAGSQVINAGTWTVAEGVTVEGSGHILNLGNMTVTGLTLVNSNSCTWVNDGTWTTDNYTYHAGSTDVINNCRLIVNDLFTINLGDTDKNCFAINAGGGVTTKDLHFAGPGYIKMAANSLFTVTNEAKMDATKVDYGFWGPLSGDGWAVLKAKNIVTSNEQQMYDITYGGNVYVACDSHFPNSYPGGENDSRPVIDFVGNAKMVEGQTNAPYTIPSEGNCNGGYNGSTDGGSRINNEPIMYYYYAFEDLGGVSGVNNTDIDFNDIVLRVSAPVDGKCDVQLVAAGGELKTKILYNGTVICEDAHEKIGGTMKNTGNVDTSKFVDIYEMNGVTDASNLPFAIEVARVDGTQGSTTVEASGLGEAPLMIKVAGISEGTNTGKWFWVKERTSIKTAYPLFVNWAADRTQNTDWYKDYVGDYVVSY